MPTRKPKRHSTLGSVVPSGRGFKARYHHDGILHGGGRTFSSPQMADRWLADEQKLLDTGTWTPPAVRRAQAQALQQRDELTLAKYAARWVDERQVRGRPIKDRTKEHYRQLLASPRWLQPLAAQPLADIDRPTVAAWWEKLPADRPTMRQHSYALLHSIMKSAAEDGIIPSNPVNIHGATAHPRPRDVELLTAAQVTDLAQAMPPEHRMAVLLAAWCGLRFGELCALRRCDLDMGAPDAVIHVRRAVVTVDHRRVATTPKSDAGLRDVIVPPHLQADLKTHVKRFAKWGREGLLFPPTSPAQDFLTPGSFYGHLEKRNRAGRLVEPASGYYGARHAIGRDDLNFHRLRHFAATTLAVAGATDKELLTALGHSSMAVAARYQHAAHNRMAALAAKMSALAVSEEGQV